MTNLFKKQKKTLSFRTEATQVWNLRHERDFTLQEIAARFGASLTWVTKRLKWAERQKERERP